MTDASRRHEGRLVSWDDPRGFGFIEAAGLSAPVFVHMKFLRSRHQRPVVGDVLRFSLGTGRDGKEAAADVEIVGAAPKQAPPPPSIADISRLFAALAILIGAIVAYQFAGAPLWFPALYFVMSLGSGLAYWLDKYFARENRPRVRETSLHMADAFFGIAGGLFAQHVFRHKTRKAAFRAITRLIFIAHATLIALVLGGLVRLPHMITG
jgi:uncharacterized membrane protein YsdA (DUF1294 family)/cold shock CspA family protein